MKKLILVLVLSIVLLNGSSIAYGASSSLAIHPNGDAGTNQWTVHCSPVVCQYHYQAVDEATADTTDFVNGVNLNDKDEWTMGDVTGTILAGAVIDSVVLTERGKSDKFQGRKAGLKIGSDYTWGTERTALGYTTYNEKLSAPGGRTWTRNNLDSLVVSVIKSTSTSTSSYVYTAQAYVTVYYTPAVSGFDTTAVTTTSVSLQCNKNTNTDYKRYKVMYSAGSTPPDSQNQSGITYGDSSTADNDTVFTVGSLSVNIQYSFSVFAKDAVPNWTQKGSGSYKTRYTKANAPSAPTVATPTCSTLNVTVLKNGNPATTALAIWITPAVGGNNYVQANGSIGASAVWQDSATWGTKTVTGLSHGVAYYFKVKARNGDNIETSFSDSTKLRTIGPCYVRKSGSDSNNGDTPSTAWLTISYAVSQMVSGDTLWIGAGDYSTEAITVTDKDYSNWTCFFGDYDGSHTGDAAGEIKVKNVCGNTDWGKVHIDHLHAVSSGACSYTGGIVFYNDSDGRVKVTHCLVDSATANYAARYYEFTNNFVKGSGGKGFWSAVRFADIDTCYIYNNTMGEYYNWSGGLVLYLDGVSSARHYWVKNNNFYKITGSSDSYIALEHYGTVNYVDINYNTFDTSNSATRFCQFKRSSWYYCTNIGSWRDSTTFDAQSDTGKSGVDTDNYHLLSSSLCLDSGTNAVSALVTDDIDGNTRPLNTAYDVGCDEFVDITAPAAVTVLDTSLADGGIDTTRIGLRCNKNDSADCGGYMVRYATGATAPATYSANNFGDSTSSRDSIYFQVTTGLSVNTQYSFSVFARDEVPNWSAQGATKTLYTKARKPSAPTVANPTTSTLDVTTHKNGNPATTALAIWITPAVGGNNYVQTNGSIGASAVWQDSATWGTKTVTGLSSGTTYYFKVKARNGDLFETSFGDSASLATISLGISVDPDNWNLGKLDPSQIKTMASEEKIFVKNTGGVAEQLSLKIDTMDTKGEWVCSDAVDGQAKNAYVMSGVFCDPHNEDISEGNFNQVQSDDVIDTVIQWAIASSDTFAIDKDTYGASVAVGDSVALWLQMKMPTTASGPKADSTRNIIIQVGCQQAP